MKLSILDQVPISEGSSPQEALQETVKLAKLGDELGYKRYWIAEHHDMKGLGCPAPDMVLSLIGSQTNNIRIGAGAVLLPHYMPFHVVEKYNLLATLYPNRVDLGIGRAPGGSAEVTMALSANFLENVRQMPSSIDNLLHFLNQSFPKDHMFSKINPTPLPPVSPVLWLLGTSEKSAIQAAEKGLPYAFGHFMSDEDGPSIIKSYKQGEASKEALIAVSVICAETNEEANILAMDSKRWKIEQAKGEGNGVPDGRKTSHLTTEEKRQLASSDNKLIIGNPKQVRKQLEELQRVYKVDEFMILTITHNYEARRRSYKLLAEEFDL
ncbi:MsnO8 family LLM class oxidoreductase [Virgibacillus halodenitrificans]|uniref:LLM class flavin-dependent oxidoreductase n=1 Tax=Virgibacillus halodenitrificans TaxID=1482 RepID=UPI00137103A4|nr:LLM class flavin-dependent oxidoreductase [Virgibacillus halodenitrificans]MYL44536.1 MsnO8 family LLM class oxidoreductase [Virgibacillus halodenitrificans]